MVVFTSLPTLHGPTAYLRPVTANDTQGRWWQWLNDPNVVEMMDKGYAPNTSEAQRAFFEKVSQSGTDAVFAICLNESGQHIGIAGLHRINPERKTGQFGIIIGETAYHRRGIGFEAWGLALEYAFDSLCLQTISTMIVPDNVASMKIAHRFGFKEMERLKNFIKKKTRAYDYATLILTRDNWTRADISAQHVKPKSL